MKKQNTRGTLFCQRWQVQVTGEGEEMENIIKNKTTSNRSPMPWGPLDPPQKLFIRLKASIPGVQTTFNELHNTRHLAAFSDGMVHLKKPSRWPKALIGPPCHGVFIMMVCLLLLLPLGCSKKKEEKKVYKKNPVMVKVQAVEQGPVVQSLNYKGTVFPWKRANIQPDTSGRVHKIYKKQGDPVKKGDLLAELDTTTLDLQLKQAEAALAVAKAAHKDTSMNVDRLKKLYRKAAISKIQLEKAELSLESAAAQEKSAQATVNVIEHTLGNCYMRAPFNGIITSKNSEEGDVINPMMAMASSSSVLTLMHLETVKVVLDVPSEDIEKINIGQPCGIRASTLEDEVFTGEVYSRNLAADTISKTFKVEIKIKNPGLKIKAGVFAEVLIEISRKKNCLILPLSALIEEGESTFVVLYDKGQAKFKNIHAGEKNDRVFEILEGLSLGQLVVIEGNYDLKDGAPITHKGADQ